ncbi:class I SAM-dependent methyltransferase [Streptomyces nitrosporeus]|uniref:class I SAM-dependent methyltransferase n=1 Tax=Streptomyces nitrosporeus TaxID=28894 RepID=UPI003318AE5E
MTRPARPAYLTAVQESYDTVAADYAARVKDPAELDPLSRAMLHAFAEDVREAGPGPVMDVGCGPGKVTAYLSALGVPVSGLDISPKMAGLARRAHPGVRFTVGTFTGLPRDDGSLGGVLAYYSTHHTPPGLLPRVFAEFHRALAPGGRLMLAGHVGDGEHLRPTRAYGGHPVSYESHLLPPDRIAGLLDGAGLTVTARLVEGPGSAAERGSAAFFARKPGGPRPRTAEQHARPSTRPAAMDG